MRALRTLALRRDPWSSRASWCRRRKGWRRRPAAKACAPSPGQRRRGKSPGQRQSRLPGLGANSPKTNGGPRQRTPYQMDQSSGLNGQRRPTPRRGARGTGYSPRGNTAQQAAQQQAQQQAAQQQAVQQQQQQAQGWTTGNEAPGHVTTAKLSPRKGQPEPQSDPKRTSPETDPPDSPPTDDVSPLRSV